MEKEIVISTTMILDISWMSLDNTKEGLASFSTDGHGNNKPLASSMKNGQLGYDKRDPAPSVMKRQSVD